MAEIGSDLQRAKSILESGGLVAIPTETVYGLAGNALNPEAVARIFEVKNRPSFDPLIVHLPTAEALSLYAQPYPKVAGQLAAAFWPGPLTLLLPRKSIIPDLVTSGLPEAGFRVPAHELTLRLLKSLSFPLAAPSANPFGYVSPTTPEHVEAQLGTKLDYILDGGPCSVGVESTIIAFREKPLILRPGGLSMEALQQVIGAVEIAARSTSNPIAPGLLTSHYAPRKKLILGTLSELVTQYPISSSAILSFRTDYQGPYQIILSNTGSLVEAAQRLFSALRIMDQMPVDQILAERLPMEGLGLAINDRLQRAAGEG